MNTQFIISHVSTSRDLHIKNLGIFHVRSWVIKILFYLGLSSWKNLTLLFLQNFPLYCKKNYQNILSRTGFIKVLIEPMSPLVLLCNLKLTLFIFKKINSVVRTVQNINPIYKHKPCHFGPFIDKHLGPISSFY
jgi:hypothetical protein